MKRFLGIVLVAVVLFAASGCKKKDAAKTEEDYVFKIGYIANNLCHSPLYIAAENGYYDQEG
ncbi:MAG: hypothetical protein LBD74_02690, partial [Spirochaetaceae bacterium]|nr:hypothetical protein [Spirochaetaceae bacterium]